MSVPRPCLHLQLVGEGLRNETGHDKKKNQQIAAMLVSSIETTVVQNFNNNVKNHFNINEIALIAVLRCGTTMLNSTFDIKQKHILANSLPHSTRRTARFHH